MQMTLSQQNRLMLQDQHLKQITDITYPAAQIAIQETIQATFAYAKQHPLYWVLMQQYPLTVFDLHHQFPDDPQF